MAWQPYDPNANNLMAILRQKSQMSQGPLASMYNAGSVGAPRSSFAAAMPQLQNMMPPAAAPEQAAAPTPAAPAMTAMPQVAGMAGSGMGILLGQKPNLSGAGGPENDYMGTTPYNNGVAAPASTPRPPMRPQDMGPTMPSNFAVRGYSPSLPTFGGQDAAQSYADQFAGGDLNKVKARTIMVDGQPYNDFYTKNLFGGDAVNQSDKMLAAGSKDDEQGGLMGFLGLNRLFGGA
jgi:hypothetical protein